MAQKLINTVKGIQQDISDNQKDGEVYSFALNATIENFSEEQSFPYLSNTPSNFLCYKMQENEMVLGVLSIHELNKTILAIYNSSTNLKKFVVTKYKFENLGKSEIPLELQEQSEICESEILMETNCFLWSENNPIKLVYKITDCTLNIYWNNCLDEDRYIYFDLLENNELKINEDFLVNNGSLCEPELSNIVNCDKTKFYPNISYPCIETSLISGEKEKGAYSYLIAYSTNSGVPLTNFKSITQPFNIVKKNQGIKLNITNLTQNSRYKYFTIVSVNTIKGITTYSKKAVLSVNQTEWFDQDNSGTSVSGQELFTQYPFYKNSCDLTISNDIMFKSGLSEFEKFNLQPIVNLFEFEWVSIVLKEGDFKRPEIAQKFKSLLRDETYAFGVQFISSNGEELPVYQAVGRDKKSSDGIVVETKISSCGEEKIEKWQRFTTATKSYTNSKNLTDIYDSCSGKEIYEYGDFGYYESNVNYPNVPEVWNSEIVGGQNLCGKPIRHFKTPDLTISLHQSSNEYDEINYIFPIGFRLKSTTNVSKLLDLAVDKDLISQEQRKRIVGYKILRANRYGNKSIIAKGLLYDVWRYEKLSDVDSNFNNGCKNVENNYYYPNYPFNDLRDDPFISSDNSHFSGKNKSVIKQKFYRDDDGFKKRYTFHSPETHFTQPELGNIIKIEAEVYGKAKGYFNRSEEFAQYKLLSEKHYNVAKIFAQWMASTITSPSEGAISGTAANIGKSIGGSIPGLSNLGASLGEMIGGLVGTNISKNSLSSRVFKNSVILAETDKILNLFKLFGNYRQYHYQYQAVAKYNKIIPYLNEQDKVTDITVVEYIPEGKITIQEEQSNINFNNSFRESSVYLKTKNKLPNTYNLDTSRIKISDNSQPIQVDAPVTNIGGLPRRFRCKATTGRFELWGVYCSPKIIDGRVQRAALLAYFTPGSTSNFDFTTDCEFVDIEIQPSVNFFGFEKLDEGDLEIEVIEECDGLPCSNSIESVVKYPCDCNKPTDTNVSSFYVSIKNEKPNQYKSVFDIEWLDTGNCITTIDSYEGYKVAKGRKIDCDDIVENITEVEFITNC